MYSSLFTSLLLLNSASFPKNMHAHEQSLVVSLLNMNKLFSYLHLLNASGPILLQLHFPQFWAHRYVYLSSGCFQQLFEGRQSPGMRNISALPCKGSTLWAKQNTQLWWSVADFHIDKCPFQGDYAVWQTFIVNVMVSVTAGPPMRVHCCDKPSWWLLGDQPYTGPHPGPLSGLLLCLQVLVMIHVGGSMTRNFAAHGSWVTTIQLFCQSSRLFATSKLGY